VQFSSRAKNRSRAVSHGEHPRTFIFTLLSKGNLNIKSEYLHNIKRLLENENRFPLPSSIIDVVVLASQNERRWNNAYEYRYARLQR